MALSSSISRLRLHQAGCTSHSGLKFQPRCSVGALTEQRCGVRLRCAALRCIPPQQQRLQQFSRLERMPSCLRAFPDSYTLPVVSSEEEFNKAVAENDLLVVDFMARWCRKCIYLKPKLERMLKDDFPGLPLLFIDVNEIPSAVVYNAGIKKMPTIQLYKSGTKVVEHVAAEGAVDALMKIKLMILRNTDLKLP